MRIVLMGPHGTGKSTISKELKKVLSDHKLVHNVGRIKIKNMYIKQLIISVRWFLNTLCLKYISCRSFIDQYIYSSIFAPNMSYILKNLAEFYCKYIFTHIIYVGPYMDLIDESEIQEERSKQIGAEVEIKIKTFLKEINVTYKELESKILEERVNECLKYIMK